MLGVTAGGGARAPVPPQLNPPLLTIELPKGRFQMFPTISTPGTRVKRPRKDKRISTNAIQVNVKIK